MRLIRTLFLLLGVIALLVAVAAIAAQLAAPEANARGAHLLGAVWAKHHFASYNAVQVGIERHLGLGWLWQNVIQPMLLWRPIAVAGVFAALGLVLIWLGRSGRRRA